MLRLVAHAAECFPRKEFFLCADEKMPSVTGAELYGLCRRAEAVLNGFGEKQHIALLGPSSAAWLTAFFAILASGQTAVPLHDSMQLRELEECLRLAGCGLLICDGRRSDAASALGRALPGLKILDLHAFIGQLREEERESLPELEPDSVGAMYFTSGTTGKPRPPFGNGCGAFPPSAEPHL